MRYTKQEKMEVIRIVERSELSLKRTLKELGISKATFYNWYNKYLEQGPDGLEDKKSRSSWNKIPKSYRAKVIEVALVRTEDSPREIVTFMTNNSGTSSLRVLFTVYLKRLTLLQVLITF